MNWKKSANLFLSMLLAFSTMMSDVTVYAEGEEETEEPVIEEVTETEETSEPEVTEIVTEEEVTEVPETTEVTEPVETEPPVNTPEPVENEEPEPVQTEEPSAEPTEGEETIPTESELEVTAEDSDVFTITFDANGGHFEDGSELMTVESEEGTSLTEIPEVFNDDETVEFSGWYISDNTEPVDFETFTVDDDYLFIAGWETSEESEEEEEDSELFEDGSDTVDLDELALEEELVKADYVKQQFNEKGTTLNLLLDMEYPTEVLVNLFKANGQFQIALNGWNLTHVITGSQSVGENQIKLEDYYEAILLSIFLDTDNSQYTGPQSKIMDVWEKANSKADNLREYTSKLYDVFASRDTKLANLDGPDLSNLKKSVKQFYSDEAKEVTDAFDSILSYATTIGEFEENLAKYVALYNACEEDKLLLAKMYQDAKSMYPTNIPLQSAFVLVQNAMTDRNNAILAAAEKGGIKTLDEVGNALIKDLVKFVCDSNPAFNSFYFGMQLGDKISTFFMNQLVSTDKLIEQYQKMKCLYDVMSVMRTSVRSMSSSYSGSSRTVANAHALTNAADRLFDIAVFSCDYAKDFADIIAHDGVLSYFSDTSGEENLIKSCDRIKKSLIFGKNSQYMWKMTYLFNEHPEYFVAVYGDYTTFLDKYYGDYVNVTGLHFTENSYVIGLEDTVIKVPEAVVEPSSATDKVIYYTSSDTNILDVNGSLIPKKAGQVTLTATTKDGGYTAQVPVTVVEGTSEGYYIALREGLWLDSNGNASLSNDVVLYSDGLIIGDMTIEKHNLDLNGHTLHITGNVEAAGENEEYKIVLNGGTLQIDGNFKVRQNSYDGYNSTVTV
ncbi:MAG: hypothetical protein K6F23_02845, partial [Solobacterium sp.]|nr:hypothetical protein [Solobacterium sp.]